MFKNKIYLSLLVLILILTGASCESCTKKKDGGIFKSENSAETWTQKNFMKKVKRKTYTINEYQITCFRFDPVDTNILYAGTKGNGIIITKNGGNSWENTNQKNGTIYDIDIDPIDDKIIYAAKDTSIIKSTDQGSNWEVIHTDPNKALFSKVVVDTYDPNKIYAAAGAVLYKSIDKGVNWEIIMQLGENIKNILIRNQDTRIIFLQTTSGKLYRTTNAGVKQEIVPDKEKKQEVINGTWYNLITKAHKELWPTGSKVFNVYINNIEPTAVYITTKRGLLKSNDNGDSWQAFSTLIPVDDTDNQKIINLTIDPLNLNNMYFTLSGTNKIHKSTDGGKVWKIIENFPSTQLITKMIIDPKQTNILYIGIQKPKEKKGLIK